MTNIHYTSSITVLFYCISDNTEEPEHLWVKNLD